MARVTVEDCVEKVPNRFDLVMLAAQRARDISSGAALTVERDKDKNPVIALREIADETLPLENLAESLIMTFQKLVEIDEPEEDAPEFDVPSVPGAVEGEGSADTPTLQADALALEEPATDPEASGEAAPALLDDDSAEAVGEAGPDALESADEELP